MGSAQTKDAYLCGLSWLPMSAKLKPLRRNISPKLLCYYFCGARRGCKFYIPICGCIQSHHFISALRLGIPGYQDIMCLLWQDLVT